MCEFRDQVECRKYCLERHSPRGSYHLVEPAGRTHLLGKAFRIVDLECIIRAKQDRTPGQKMVWQQRYEFWNGLKLINQNDVPVLGLAGCHKWRNWKLAGTSMSAPIDITDDTLASSLVPVQCASLAPPAKKETENWISGCTTQNAEWIEVLHLFRCFTHTHKKTNRDAHCNYENVCLLCSSSIWRINIHPGLQRQRQGFQGSTALLGC